MSLILVIDDESEIRKLVRLVLERHGHDVLEAADAAAAIRIAAKQAFDLAICDLELPGMMPAADIESARAVAMFGADRALGKPFSPSRLAAVVAELLQSGALQSP